MADNTEREAFEAWYFDRFMATISKQDDGRYSFIQDRDMFDAWRARALAQGEPGEAVERALSHELIKVAAWLLSPEPRRQLDQFEDSRRIGYRQIHRAQDAMHETLRKKAMEIRAFVDATRSPTASAPAAEREPLNEAEIQIMFRRGVGAWMTPGTAFAAGVRFAELHHGIGTKEPTP